MAAPTHKTLPNWRDDLEASLDISKRKQEQIGFLIAWYESWRLSHGHQANRDSARLFWKDQIKSKPRLTWQLTEWAAAIRWYLNWLDLCAQQKSPSKNLVERVNHSTNITAARRGLSRLTRKAYCGWVCRFASWAGNVNAVMDQHKAAEWLSQLVLSGKIGYSTQKQALCALKFFFQQVCSKTVVNLKALMLLIIRPPKKRRSEVSSWELHNSEPPRPKSSLPNFCEILSILDKLNPKCRLAKILHRPAIRYPSVIKNGADHTSRLTGSLINGVTSHLKEQLSFLPQ